MSEVLGRAPESLEEFNRLLAASNLPILDDSQFQALQEERPKGQLVKAATLISEDAGARAYITKAMSAIGVDAKSSKSSTARPPDPKSGATPNNDISRSDKPASISAERSKAPENGQVGSPFANNVHVYGGKAALCFEPTLTRNNEDPTVTMDAARANRPRQYEWDDKVRIQFTRSELPVVACVLLGLIPSCKYENHGANNNKGFSFENQDAKLFVKVWAKDQGVRPVPVEPPDIYRITTLVLSQLQTAAPSITTEGLIQTLRLTIARRVAMSSNGGDRP